MHSLITRVTNARYMKNLLLMPMANKNNFLFLLLILLCISCSIKVKEPFNFQKSSYYLDIDASVEGEEGLLGSFQSSILFFKNINDTIDVYINGRFYERLISEKDSLSSRQTIVSLEIENKNEHQKIDVYLISKKKNITFYTDPYVPFYDIYYLYNGVFRINGYMGEVSK